MNLKNLLKWGNRWETGKMIFIIVFGLCLLLFINRFSLVPNQIADFCIKENVKFWQSGVLQLIRSVLEHFAFNFIVPILFVIFSLGFDRLFKQYLNWKWFFGIGALSAIAITFIWEFQKRPVECIEIIYDITAIILSYLFVRWMLKEFDEASAKKEEIRVRRK